jgi:hypothetical protein
MEKPKAIFDDWLKKQRQSYMLSQPVKKLLFEAFLFGMSYKENNQEN